MDVRSLADALAHRFPVVIQRWHELEYVPVEWRDNGYRVRALIWASALAVGANRHRMSALTQALRHGVPIADIARALDIHPDARTIRELWEPWALGEMARHHKGKGTLSPEEFDTIRDSLIAEERPPT
ncbi:hypothetical protein [Nonomuraea longicatena]|uniref:Uncharacterized protein n=1 Tax=Nonomuraea longicatena TaxID=83682 RepID=A0ABN1NUH5_9ACTN